MMKKQRVELGAGMVLGGLGLLTGRFILINPVSDFFCGTYRKWLANRERQM